MNTESHFLAPLKRTPGVPGLAIIALTALQIWPSAAAAQPDLEGIWGIDPELFHQYSEPQFTAEGQRRHEAYDVLTDDPSYGCVPSGLGRAWDEPDTTSKIEQFEDRVVISYEMFDLVRTIELDRNGHPIDAEPSTVNLDGVSIPTMGHSIGWYDGDALMIETIGYAPGYITTLRRYPPHSEALRSLERIYRDEENRLVVEITYVDPIIYSEPVTSTNRYYRSDFPFSVYGCVPFDVEGETH
jgi:hypothetical protein